MHLELHGYNVNERPISVITDSVTVDGITVGLKPYERACALADAMRHTFFVGRVWELDPNRPGYHRDTDRHIISDSREVMKQFCGSWQGLGMMVRNRGKEQEASPCGRCSGRGKVEIQAVQDQRSMSAGD